MKDRLKKRKEFNKINREKEILRLEESLDLVFPQSYRQFLLKEGSAVIGGFNILGIPTEGKLDLDKLSEDNSCPLCRKPKQKGKIVCFNCYKLYIKKKDSLNRGESLILSQWLKSKLPQRKEKELSVFEATQILRTKRPKLSKKLAVISIDKNRALCLDLENTTKQDAPLVEIDLTGKEFLEPIEMKPRFFKEWVELHQETSKRLSAAWNRIRNRQKEAKSKGVGQWKAVISRVKDYIIALGAFRYNFFYACLEVDEFYTLDQPGLVREGSGVRVLVNEMFSRARDYSGSLNIVFTKNIRENIHGEFYEEFREMRSKRIPRQIPKELIELSKKYDVNFKEASKGRISHKEGVNLYFSLIELPHEVEEKIKELEGAGYLSKEIITEVIAKGIWTKEETIWLFLNAPRPEGILLGTDLPENRLFYSESFNYGRSVLLATRFQQAIMAYITGGVSVEEIEKVKSRCYLEPKKNFWILKCNQGFCIPPSWTIDKSKKWVKTEESVLLLSRPRFSGDPEYDKSWIKDNIKMLLNSEIEANVRCLLLSNEMINTLMLNIIYKDKNPAKVLREIKNLVKVTEQRGIHVLFAPTRMYLLLDEEIQRRMRRTRNMKHFPSRKAPLELWLIKVPNEEWEKPSGLRNASRDARTFARLIVKKVDINRYRKDFAFNCEVVEREAFQNYPVIAKFENEEGEKWLRALETRGSEYQGITFSYFSPTEIDKSFQGGIVVINPPWKPLPVGPIPKIPEDRKQIKLLSELVEKICLEINKRKKINQYISSRREIDSFHQQLNDSLKDNIPLSMASIRSHIFVEGIRDYLYQDNEIEEQILLRIAYGDGTQEELFPLFAFSEIEKPAGNFYYLPVALVSLRHMEVDYFTEMSLIRNVEIQRKETSADQEEFAFRKVYSQIEEFLKLLRREIDEEELSLSYKALLVRKPEIQTEHWYGLKLDMYLSTGLKPVAIGAFRAVIELLRKYRGRLIVVPRIISGRLRKSVIERKGLGGIKSNYYGQASEWY